MNQCLPFPPAFGYRYVEGRSSLRSYNFVVFESWFFFLNTRKKLRILRPPSVVRVPASCSPPLNLQLCAVLDGSLAGPLVELSSLLIKSVACESILSGRQASRRK